MTWTFLGIACAVAAMLFCWALTDDAFATAVDYSMHRLSIRHSYGADVRRLRGTGGLEVRYRVLLAAVVVLLALESMSFVLSMRSSNLQHFIGFVVVAGMTTLLLANLEAINVRGLWLRLWALSWRAEQIAQGLAEDDVRCLTIDGVVVAPWVPGKLFYVNESANEQSFSFRAKLGPLAWKLNAGHVTFETKHWDSDCNWVFLEYVPNGLSSETPALGDLRFELIHSSRLRRNWCLVHRSVDPVDQLDSVRRSIEAALSRAAGEGKGGGSHLLGTGRTDE
jgi:hypothetical protein